MSDVRDYLERPVAGALGSGNPVPPLFWFRDADGNTLMVVEVQDS